MQQNLPSSVRSFQRQQVPQVHGTLQHTFFKQGSGKGHKISPSQANSQAPGREQEPSARGTWERQGLAESEHTFGRPASHGTSFGKTLYFLHSEYVVLSFLSRKVWHFQVK